MTLRVIYKRNEEEIMNQILFSESGGNQVSNKTDITSIIKFFCIFIIVFALAVAGSGVYGFLQNGGAGGKVDTSIKPVIQFQMLDEKTISIVVNHNQPIKYLEYIWNDEIPERINGNGRKDIQETINVIPGNSTLYILVEDITGNQGIKTEEVSYITGSDIEKPKISLNVTGNYIEIKATDETEIDYITYQWEGETAVTVRPTNVGDKIITEKIEVKKGKNRLTVIAIDKEGNEETEEKTYKGITKPDIYVVQEGNTLVISVKDQEGLTYMDIDLNIQKYRVTFEQSETDIVYNLPMETGENVLIVVAYSKNGESATYEGKAKTF